MISRLIDRFNGKGLGAKLVRIASGSFMIKIAGAGVAFGLQLLLARILNASGYGAYIYVITCVNFLVLPVILGFDTATLRFIPQYIGKKNYAYVFGYIKRSQQIVLFSGLIVISVISLYLHMEQAKIANGIYQLYVLALLLLPINAVIRLKGSLLQSLNKVLISQFYQVILRPLLIAGTVTIAYLYTQENLAEIAIMANVISGLLIIFVFAFIVKKQTNKIKTNVKDSFDTKQWLFVSLPLLLNTGFNVILSQADILMIGYFFNQDKVGIYAAVTKTAGLVTFVLTAVNSIAAPMISQLYAEGKKAELQKIVTLAARLTFFTSLPICIVLMQWSEQILSLFGTQFTSGSEALIYLAGAQLFSALAGSVGFIMIMTGHQNQANLILIISALVNVVANYYLIPMFGINGAAYATALSIFTWNFFMYIYTRKKVGINPTVMS